MTPDTCPKCGDYFMDSVALQTEAEHQVRKYGPGAALAWLRETMAGYHDEHDDERDDEPGEVE